MAQTAHPLHGPRVRRLAPGLDRSDVHQGLTSKGRFAAIFLPEQGDGRVGRVVGVRFVPWGGLGLYGPSGPSLTNAFMCMGQAFATVNTYSPR